MTIWLAYPAPGLGNYVEALFKKGGAQFNVSSAMLSLLSMILSRSDIHTRWMDINDYVLIPFLTQWEQARLVQQNGDILEKPSLHVLLIDQTRIKLSRGRTIKAKEEYSSILQVVVVTHATRILPVHAVFFEPRNARATTHKQIMKQQFKSGDRFAINNDNY